MPAKLKRRAPTRPRRRPNAASMAQLEKLATAPQRPQRSPEPLTFRYLLDLVGKGSCDRRRLSP